MLQKQLKSLPEVQLERVLSKEPRITRMSESDLYTICEIRAIRGVFQMALKARSDSAKGGRAMPRSVMIALMYRNGVTSKAGLAT
jgi:hypothetical protein